MSKTHSRHRSGARPDHSRASNTKAEAKEAKSPSEKRILEAKAEFAPPGGEFIGRRVGRTSTDLGDVLRPISPEERRAGVPSTARRNALKNVAKTTHELEDSATTPSRKSTRKAGVTHVKSDANLRLRATRAASAPKTVAARARVTAKKPTTRRTPA